MTSHGFAHKQMKRYGWSEGKGLGRTESGMKNAIKVKLKNNMGGLGHDQGAEFTFHWWDHLFNKAANSFKVSESDEGALIEKCEGKKVTPLLISTKKGISSKLSNKSLLYGTFVKSGTYNSNSVKTSDSITDSGEESSDDDDDDDDDKKVLLNNNTLDKMFKETGLTGHKAARHGFALSGKLQRLQKQEDKEYTKLKGDDDTENNTCNDGKVKKKKKEKKKGDSKSKLVSNNIQGDVVGLDNEDNMKKKKKKKRIEKDLEVISHLSNVAKCIGIKLKKGKHKLEDTKSLLDDQPKKKKKKKKK